MRRLVGFVLMTALMAPALAVCAAGARPVRASSEHDCCPKDAGTISAAESPSAQSACCRMSADAARRGAIQAVELAAPAAPAGSIVTGAALDSVSRALARYDRHPESPHIARHLLLSVLLI